MMKVYVLEVVTDTPYHEGSEYWFDTSVQTLIDTTPGLEDASEVSLTLRTFGEEASVMIANNWDDDRLIDKIDYNAYDNVPGPLPDHIYYCRQCDIFFPLKIESPYPCEKCGNECICCTDH